MSISYDDDNGYTMSNPLKELCAYNNTTVYVFYFMRWGKSNRPVNNITQYKNIFKQQLITIFFKNFTLSTGLTVSAAEE